MLTPWAYKVIKLHNLELSQFEAMLARAGLDGWELVGITNMEKSVIGGLTGGSMVAVMKRPATTADMDQARALPDPEDYWG